MKAVRIHEHGGPEVLRLEEVPAPQPGPHQVLVRVRAVALNHIDLWLRGGLPRVRVEFPHILGADVAGEVAALGPGVTGWREGDAVLLHPGVSCGRCPACLAGLDNRCPEFSILGEHIPGGYAQYVTVPEQNLLPKPPHLSFEEAAAMPLVFLTAWNMLVTNARLRFGEDVLVRGAGSGVGSAAFFAVALTAVVIGAAGPVVPWPAPTGHPVAVIIDVSAACEETNVRSTRIEAARTAALDFVDGLPRASKVTLVTFGSQVTVVVPLTDDRARLREVIVKR